MKFIALKTGNGREKGGISFYCRALGVTRQGFYSYLERLDKSWKYEALAAQIKDITAEDECDDTYGYVRMHEALVLKRETQPGLPPHTLRTDGLPRHGTPGADSPPQTQAERADESGQGGAENRKIRSNAISPPKSRLPSA